mmetsp:Transcript_92028/g.154411  ORF Transcript_92028/g.154411 Transcript_92028/m.154411 type:complete len:91 (+) Transcript_92028:142-414(+)
MYLGVQQKKGALEDKKSIQRCSIMDTPQNPQSYLPHTKVPHPTPKSNPSRLLHCGCTSYRDARASSLQLPATVAVDVTAVPSTPAGVRNP